MNQARILVVDDNRSLVHVITRLLHRQGYEVLTALNGQAGLEKARAARPDLIILDVVMPGLDGYQVCRLLQSDPATAAIPILMLTVKGHLVPEADDELLGARLEEQMAGFDAGAADFLSKPVAAQELLERVRALLWFERLPILEHPPGGKGQTARPD